MAFCDLDDVIALSQPSTGVYDDTTKPTKLQVQKWIDSFSAHLRLKLRSFGYTLPITNDDDLKYLKDLNAYAAASLAEEATAGRTNDELNPVAEDLWKKYLFGLAELEKRGVILTSASSTRIPRALHTSFVADGSDPEISDNSPRFRKDMDF
jgi:hypothetical protein